MDGRRLALHLLVALVLAPAGARGDGMAFWHVTTGGSMEVRATEQRAILWLRDTQWELHIQPVFERDAGAAAWVVPFEVRPGVHEGDADLFDQLELITSPVFIEYCTHSSGGSGLGCAGKMASDSGGYGQTQGGSASVTVWEQGEVGDLDYVVLSASSGESLASWLEAGDYALPPGAAALISDMETEETFFFVSRVSDGVDPSKPIAPVRFVLPGYDMDHPPTYPLRLTSLGVPGGQYVELTLWVIAAGAPIVPTSHSFSDLGSWPHDGPSFDEAVDSFFDTEPPGSLAALANLTGDEVAQITGSHLFCSSLDWSYQCMSFTDLGLSVPAWADGLDECTGWEMRVVRYLGRFTPSAMGRDLELVRGDAYALQGVGNVYTYSTGECEGSGDPDSYTFCSISGRPGLHWAGVVVVFVVFGVVAWLRRRA
jgi:hypothetical protein